MGKNLCLAIGKDQRQFVREPLAVVQDFCAVFFLFFPMIGELHRTPMGDVTIFSFTEYPVQHPCRTEQANMPAM
jgi:hypothetical protein